MYTYIPCLHTVLVIDNPAYYCYARRLSNITTVKTYRTIFLSSTVAVWIHYVNVLHVTHVQAVRKFTRVSFVLWSMFITHLSFSRKGTVNKPMSVHYRKQITLNIHRNVNSVPRDTLHAYRYVHIVVYMLYIWHYVFLLLLYSSLIVVHCGTFLRRYTSTVYVCYGTMYRTSR